MKMHEVDIGSDEGLIKPGDTVSFTADSGVNFYGTLEITEVTGFSITGSGSPVHVITLSDGTALDFATHGGYQIELWGSLTGGPTSCGNECWEFDYNGGTTELRAAPGQLQITDCVQWIGPLTQYFEEDQLDASDFDWVRFF